MDEQRSDSEQIHRQIQAYMNSSQAVGLAVGVYSAETKITEFAGVLSKQRDKPPDKDTLFEIGSITKVFTSTLLADMHVRGELSLDDKVNRYLPPHGRLQGKAGEEVTLRHLATHTSGLPRLPINLTWKQLLSDNPYAAYTIEDLYAGLIRCRLKNRPGSRTCYSNWGTGLLGHILELIGGEGLERLFFDRIFVPLGMHDTSFKPSKEQQERLAPGHSQGKEVPNWDFQALAGAGAIRSTLADMLRFLQANIDPPSTSLRQSIELTHELQTEFVWQWYRDFGCVAPIALVSLGGLLVWRSFGLPLWLRIAIPIAVPFTLLSLWHFGIVGSLDDMALGWHLERSVGSSADGDILYWHNGGTGGYSSYLAFSKKSKTGVIFLANSDHAPDVFGRETQRQISAGCVASGC